MKILMDTHIVLWAAVGDERLSGRLRELFEEEENQLLLSTASIWEISIKYSTNFIRSNFWNWTS